MVARLAVLVTALLAALGLAVPSPALAAPLGKPSLLTLDEAETVFPQLRGRHDDGHRNVYAFGIDAPDFTTSPLLCDRYRNYRGTSRVEGSYYSVSGPSFAFDENIVRMRTTAEARGVLAHYRAFVEACTGTHATTDGEGRQGDRCNGPRLAAPADRRRAGRHARRLHPVRLDHVAAHPADPSRARTVMLLVVEPRHGTGSAARVAEAADLAWSKLG